MTELQDRVDAAKARAVARYAEMPDDETRRRALLQQELIDLGAFLHAAPGEMQHDLLQFLGEVVLGMPLFVLASGQWQVDAQGRHLAMVQFSARMSKALAKAASPLVEKLKVTADALEQYAKEHVGDSPHCELIYDSTKAQGDA